MEKLAKSKPLFIGLSCLSVGCLVSAFGYPLQKLEVYSQTEQGRFGYSYEKRFVITESDLNYPLGFSKSKAVKVAQIYESATVQKFFLLVMSGLCAGYALLIGQETVVNSEIDSEVATIKATGRKQLLLERVKHDLALASKSQRLLFLDEMKILMEEFGSAEEEMLEADEINAFYEQAAPSEDDAGKADDAFRSQFPESMDATYWKAIQKGKDNGLSETEIATDVLGCSSSQVELGFKYVDFLAHKFMTVR
jgi:hypothetical protein